MRWLQITLSSVQLTSILGHPREDLGHVGYHMRN